MDTPTFTPNSLFQCDWLDLLRTLPDTSVDLVLTDPPYGTTGISWDKPIDLSIWWVEIKRILKPRSVVIMTGSQPFTTDLIISNREWFKYEWIWVNKSRPTMFIHAKNCPLKTHENVLVFSNGSINHTSVSDNRMTYNPQMEIGTPYTRKQGNGRFGAMVGKRPSHNPYLLRNNEGQRFPDSVIEINESNNHTVHHTQKPVALFEYLIRTYTHEGALVVDPFIGSGTTAVAAKISNRQYICGDQSAEYIEIARRRCEPEFGKPPKRSKPALPIQDLPLFAGLD